MFCLYNFSKCTGTTLIQLQYIGGEIKFFHNYITTNFSVYRVTPIIGISELECNGEVKWCYVKTRTQLPQQKRMYLLICDTVVHIYLLICDTVV